MVLGVLDGFPGGFSNKRPKNHPEFRERCHFQAPLAAKPHRSWPRRFGNPSNTPSTRDHATCTQPPRATRVTRALQTTQNGRAIAMTARPPRSAITHRAAETPTGRTRAGQARVCRTSSTPARLKALSLSRDQRPAHRALAYREPTRSRARTCP